jgi:hypothetical protein
MLGRRTLEVELRLVLAARGHSREMIEKKFFSHTSPLPERRTPALRAQLVGYEGGVAENIQTGTASRNGERVFQSWYGSSGHHRNLLSAAHRAIGVGYAWQGRRRHMWTMALGGTEGFQKASSKPPLIVYLERSLRLKDNDPAVRFQLALFCLQHDLKRQMEAECRRVVAADPDHKKARALLGEVLSPEGRWVKAAGRDGPESGRAILAAEYGETGSGVYAGNGSATNILGFRAGITYAGEYERGFRNAEGGENQSVFVVVGQFSGEPLTFADVELTILEFALGTRWYFRRNEKLHGGYLGAALHFLDTELQDAGFPPDSGTAFVVSGFIGYRGIVGPPETGVFSPYIEIGFGAGSGDELTSGFAIFDPNSGGLVLNLGLQFRW